MQLNFSSVQYHLHSACSSWRALLSLLVRCYASVLFMTQTRFCSPFDVSSQRHSFCAWLEFRGNYSATSTNMWGRWLVGCYIWYSEESTGPGPSPPRPLLAVPNVTAHPSTASVSITALLYNGPLLCCINVPIKVNIKNYSFRYHLAYTPLALLYK